MFWSFYLRGKLAFVPVTNKTEDGFYLKTEPADVVDRNDAAALQRALERVIRIGNPRVPTPPVSSYGRPGFGSHKFRSWSEFERGAEAWEITEDRGVWTLNKLRKADRGWSTEEPEESLALPAGLDPAGIAEAAVNALHERGKQR